MLQGETWEVGQFSDRWEACAFRIFQDPTLQGTDDSQQPGVSSPLHRGRFSDEASYWETAAGDPCDFEGRGW